MNITEAKNSNSLIFKMSVPIFIELLLQMFVGNIDQIMIGHFNEIYVGAIGNANIIINLVIIVLSVMSVSTTVLISRYLGSKNSGKISEVFNASIVMLAFISILITITIFAFAGLIFNWMQVPQNIFNETKAYLFIVGAFTIVQGFYMTYAAALRSYGFMKNVMLAAIFMNIVNIAGNFILINGMYTIPPLGVTGAAISTIASRFIGLILLICIFNTKTKIKISKKYLNPFSFSTVKNLLHIGIPSGAEELSYNLSQAVIMKFVNYFGTMVITTKVYCSILANFAYIYSIAISQASQIVVSYLIGSNNLKLANKRVWATLAVSMTISLFITLLLYIFSDNVFGIFTKNPEILALGKKIIFVEFFLEIGRSINIVMVRCLISVEDVKFPAYMCVFSAWTFGVGLGYIFGIVMDMGLIGIWIGMATDECIRGFILILRFKTLLWAKKVKNKRRKELCILNTRGR